MSVTAKPDRRRTCALALLALAIAAAAALALVPRVAQDEAYHRFADRRPAFGVPNFADVVTNLPFVLIGAAGLRALRRVADRGPATRGARAAATTLFAGVTLTGFGSAWYHLQPTTASLFWDRLPMTIVFSALLAWIVAERFADCTGRRLLAPFLLLGITSLLWWRQSELAGRGDLRWYGAVQFFPALAIALMLVMLPKPGSAPLLWSFALYAAAKIGELYDREIFAGLGFASGHTLKHLFAAGSTGALAVYARRRFPAPGEAEHREVAESFTAAGTLKRDVFGAIEQGVVRRGGATIPAVRRDLRRARWWARPLASAFARRERLALARLDALDGFPHLLGRAQGVLVRSWLEGRSMADARPADPAYFSEARRLLRRLHQALVTHNDTHKEPNWLVRADGSPALVDFQLAGCFRRRTRWFRLCAREDIRHLLKHKKTCCPEALTRRERALLQERSWVASWWRRRVKPVYNFVTRRLMKWRDAEGRGP